MIYLREITATDSMKLHKWRNDPQLIEDLASTYRYINKETEEEWFHHYQQNRGQEVRCAICREEDHEMIGMVSLTQIDRLNQSAQFHIMIGEKGEHGKGYGFQATRLMLLHGFHNMNLNRIQLYVLEANERATKLYEKCGFEKEGKVREYIFKNGSMRDCFLMSILKSTFKA